MRKELPSTNRKESKMSNYPENDNPFEPWSGMDADNPFAPWNDPMKKDDPFACWNNPFGSGRYRKEADEY